MTEQSGLITTKRTIASIYDDIADSYVARTCGPLGVYLDRIEFDELAGTDLTGKSILDLGCGVGRVARFLDGRASFYCGVDLSRQMVRAAMRMNWQNSLFIYGDASELPFPKRSFDVITCFGLFEYVADLLPYFGEVGSVLSDCGTFIFSCHTVAGARYFNRRGGYHRIGHTEGRLHDVCGTAGFEVVSMRPALVLSRLARLLLAVARRLRPIELRRRAMIFLGSLDHILSRQSALAKQAKELLVVCRIRRVHGNGKINA
jgi:predicted TPR repeat methyltransferase